MSKISFKTFTHNMLKFIKKWKELKNLNQKLNTNKVNIKNKTLI